MVYANFSSNLPTGLLHFEFVDLTNIDFTGIWDINIRAHEGTTKNVCKSATNPIRLENDTAINRVNDITHRSKL